MLYKFVLTLLSLAVVFSVPALAQDDERSVRIDTELVSLNVAVVDATGKAVTGLSQANFQIFDGRVEQKIEHFSSLSSGVSFGIVYDMHPTTDQKTLAVLDGLREFTKGLAPADDFFLAVFNERGSRTFDIVPDSDQLARYMASPERRDSRSLYDALYAAAQKLRRQPNLKRTLIVITDAADHNSRRSFNELIAELRKFDAQVYAIAFDDTLNRFEGYVDVTKTPDSVSRIVSDATSTDRAALNSITLRSGGATFPSTLENSRNILRISRMIAAEMHNHYTIGFYPMSPPDRKWHSLRVGLKGVAGSKKFALTYRPGYEAVSKPRP